MSITNKENMQKKVSDKWLSSESTYHSNFKSSQLIVDIEQWVEEQLIDEIEGNCIDNEDGIEQFYNQEYCNICNIFMEHYTIKRTLNIRDVEDIMSFVRNNLDDAIYDDDDFYMGIKEDFERQFDMVIYTIAKEIFRTIEPEYMAYKKIYD
mgnify:FL=1